MQLAVGEMDALEDRVTGGGETAALTVSAFPGKNAPLPTEMSHSTSTVYAPGDVPGGTTTDPTDVPPGNAPEATSTWPESKSWIWLSNGTAGGGGVIPLLHGP